MTTRAEAVLEAEPYLPLAEAAELAGVSEEALLEHVRQGTVHAVRVDGIIAVRQEDAMQLAPKERLPEYRKHTHLKGQGIGINEAAKKYGIPFSTVRRWMELGYITRLGRHGRKILLDEADVAYSAEVYHQRGRRRWKLDHDGRPYARRTVRRSRRTSE